jgi:predicted GNAT family N-acyltransferase
MSETIDFFPINVEQSHWPACESIAAAIRREVFMDEQQVSEADEWDGLDAEAIHWVAWGEGDTPMATARLVGNKIGRMAVLKPYRQKGVGSAILRSIIQYAIKENIPELILDAQVKARSFYKDNGFEVTGKEFMDAGIRHVPMAMDIQRFSHRRHEPGVPDISEELRQHVELGSREAFADAAVQLAAHSERTVRILSQRLIPEVYNRDILCQQLHALAVNHPYAKVQVLVTDVLWLGAHHHLLVETCTRLQSHMEIRRLTDEIDTPHREFMLGDTSGILYFVNPDHFQGYLCLYSPIEARRLSEAFENLWRFSAPDPQLQRLYI